MPNQRVGVSFRARRLPAVAGGGRGISLRSKPKRREIPRHAACLGMTTFEVSSTNHSVEGNQGQKARAVRDHTAEVFGNGLAHVGEGVSRAKRNAMPSARAERQNRNVLAR